jgi:hypothetical protein
MLSQENLIRVAFYNGIESILRCLSVCLAPAVSAGDGRSKPQFGPRGRLPGQSRVIPDRRNDGSSPCEARGLRPSFSGSVKAGQPSSDGWGVFVRSERHPGLASAGPGSAPSTVGQHPGMDGDCQAAFPGAARSARGKAGWRVTALFITCRTIELDADSGGGLY